MEILTKEPADNTEAGALSEKTAKYTPNSTSFKLYFMMFFAATGSYVPYFPLYLKQLGLTAWQSGTLLGLQPLIEVIGSPFWGFVADKLHKRRLVLQASLLSFGLGTMLLLTVQPRNQQCIETKGNVSIVWPLYFHAGVISTMKDAANVSITIPKKRTAVNTFETTTIPSQFVRKIDEKEQQNMFTNFLIIILLSQVLGSCVFSMSEAALVAFLDKDVRNFGRIRFWGDVGLVIASFTTGTVISQQQNYVCGELTKNYSLAFYVFACLMTLSIVITFFMKLIKPETSTGRNQNIRSVMVEFASVQNGCFLVVVTFLGNCNGLNGNFGLWYLDDLGATPFMVAVAAGVRFMFSLSGYVASKRVDKLLGHHCGIAVCLLLYAGVYCAFSFIRVPWVGILLFSCQGALFSLSWSLCVIHGGDIAMHLGFSATIQGFLGGLHWGLGLGGGSILIGTFVEKFGIRTTYLSYSIASLVLFCCFVSVYRCTSQNEPNIAVSSWKYLPVTNSDSGEEDGKTKEVKSD